MESEWTRQKRRQRETEALGLLTSHFTHLPTVRRCVCVGGVGSGAVSLSWQQESSSLAEVSTCLILRGETGGHLRHAHCWRACVCVFWYWMYCMCTIEDTTCSCMCSCLATSLFSIPDNSSYWTCSESWVADSVQDLEKTFENLQMLSPGTQLQSVWEIRQQCFKLPAN